MSELSAQERGRFDVIVVGGRPAGASLAIRLARRGLSVLVVDKAEFPSAPEVPSCPIMYASSVALFDEVGFVEDRYAHAATRLYQGVVGFEGYFSATLRVPEMFGRDYFYGFNRALFDGALWEHLRTVPNVTCRGGFTVSELVRDDTGRVTGIAGGTRGAQPEQFAARLGVVGADGRHSFVARKLGARVVEDHDVHTSTIHFAEWEDVAPVTRDGSPALHVVSTGRGENALFFPSAAGRVSVAIQIRSDRADVSGDPEAYYARHLQALPTVRGRLARARRTGPLLGVRRIANRYREVGGPGWVLVGDAAHHKDPLDGQGIHDALIGARELADQIAAVHAGQITWSELLVRYRDALRAATHPMFEQTMKRLERDLHTDPNPVMVQTLLRWAMTDPEYQKRFLLFVGRAIAPGEFRTPKLLGGRSPVGSLAISARSGVRYYPSSHDPGRHPGAWRTSPRRGSRQLGVARRSDRRVARAPARGSAAGPRGANRGRAARPRRHGGAGRGSLPRDARAPGPRRGPVDPRSRGARGAGCARARWHRPRLDRRVARAQRGP